MILIRMLVAVVLFTTGIYLVYDMFAHGFHLYVLLGAIGSFSIAHWVWPKNEDGDEALWIIEVLDLVICLPFRAVALILRGAGGLLRGGTDLDI